MVTPINQTHTIATFIGNGTLIPPNTTEAIGMTNNGTAIVSSMTGSAYGLETIRTEDGDTTTITFYEIVKSDPSTRQEKGIIIAVFPTTTTNATGGSLAPFSGMVTAGLHEVQPNAEGIITLWEWESGIGSSNNSSVAPPPIQ